jgi:hypothetical protein
MDVTRGEFDRVIDLLNERGEILKEYRQALDDIRHDLAVQFKRIAQLQAEVDELRRGRS